MCPLSGERIRPFYIGIHTDFPKGDIRHRVIRHLEHELEGVLPPSGELEKKLLWAEIGVIIPSHEENKTGMVWICLPNRDAQNFKVEYEKVIEEIKKDKLHFSYNKLTSNLYSNELVQSKQRPYKCLLESHFMTIKESTGANDSKCEFKNECSAKINNELGNGICNVVVAVAECDEKEAFCNWVNVAANLKKIMCTDTTGVPHTFFLILKPGSYFHEDIRTLQNNIIGSALLVWDFEPPSHKEILSARRNIINTLGLELGTKLHLLKLSKYAATAIPALIELAKNSKPFSVVEQHDDLTFEHRRKICEMMKSTCNCQSKGIDIAHKQYTQVGRGVTNDFCGTLDEYKGMFQSNHNGTRIFMDKSQRNNFRTLDTGLFKNIVLFLGLKIKMAEGIKDIELPYCPSWLFLATIRLLSDTLKATEIELFKNTSDNVWCMSIQFPLRPPGANPTNSKNNLKAAIESPGGKGDTSSAIRNVLYGSLGVLREYMSEVYPDNQVVRKIIAENNEKLMKYEIGWDIKNLKVCFRWPSKHLPTPRLKGFATDEEVREARVARRPNTLFLSVGEQCNLNCIYCYTVPRRLRPDRQVLSFDEQKKLLDDAVSLGVRYLVIPGPGEPLLYDSLDELVSVAIERGLYITIITNGTLIDDELARRYKNLPVSFMVKLNSRDKDAQDNLIGRSGMAEKIYRAIDILVEHGFTGFPETRLAIDALLCQQTMNEMEDIVSFALQRKIYPVVERLLPLGRGLTNRSSLEVDETVATQALHKVQRLMGERTGNSFSGSACDLHDYTLFADVDGMITKCVGGQREILIGDWRNEPLNTIWERQLNILAEDAIGKQSGSSCHQASKCPGRSHCEAKYGLSEIGGK